MNKIIKSLAILTIFLTLGISSSNAQNPTFRIEYSGCELSCLHYTTVINYAIIEIPNGGTPNVIYGPKEKTISYPEFGWAVNIPDWDCDQSTDKIQYVIVINVKRYDDQGILVCSGDLRTNPMPCRDLYNNTLYTVLLN